MVRVSVDVPVNSSPDNVIPSAIAIDLVWDSDKFNVEFDPKALAWPTIILPPINFSAEVKSLDPESVTVPEVSVS